MGDQQVVPYLSALDTSWMTNSLHRYLIPNEVFVEDGTFGAFMQLLLGVQNMASIFVQIWLHSRGRPLRSQDIARQFHRCATAFLELIPLMLATIDEYSGRCPPGFNPKLDMSPEDMVQLADACASWQTTTLRNARLDLRDQRASEYDLSFPHHMDYVAVLTRMADAVEEMPTRLRMQLMELRTVNDPLQYVDMQTWLLYQGPLSYSALREDRMLIQRVPVPLALSYLGPTLIRWAEDIRSVPPLPPRISWYDDPDNVPPPPTF